MPKYNNKKTLSPGVLFLIETSTSYGRGIMDGIGQYARKHGPWRMCFERRGQVEPPPEFLRFWQGDGIISRTATPTLAKRVRALGRPVVELLGHRQIGPAMVQTDNIAVGRLAAEHLLDCGLRHFGFFGSGNSLAVPVLRDGFQRTLAEKGYECAAFLSPKNKNLLPAWQNIRLPALVAWLRGLPQPVGVFASDSEHALCLVDVCNDEGIAVPEQVAILANDDDPVLYNVTTPALSGVDTNARGVGYEAAALLDRMMGGQQPPKKPLMIQPLCVVARQSTDILNIADRDMAQAVRFIREHACRGIDVPCVAEAASLSRRVLERRFQEHLGRSPKEEIMRVRIEQARQLLAGSDLAIEWIAKKSGIDSFRNFATVFRREVGVTPRQFRRKHRMW